MPDIVTSQVFSDGEKGITATKMNNIIANSVIQPDFVTAKPSSSTLDPTDQLLEVKGAGTYARITGSQLISSVSAQVDVTPQIYSARLRSFNAIGNPTFEVDQRNIMNGLSNPSANTFIQDRWALTKAASVTLTGNWNPLTLGVAVPGTSFFITRTFLRFGLLTQQATLGAGDNYGIYQNVEGTRWRELMGDVTSLSLLVRSSVAPLKFACSLRDAPGSVSLTKLCTISTANTWTLIQLPNLPVPSGGTFNYTPGAVGYIFGIHLCVGSTFTAPAADTWQSGNFIGAPGMDNFASKPLNSTFDIAYAGHEPGAVCTTLQDCPWQQNYDDALRYFAKSYDYDVAVGTANAVGDLSFWQQSVASAYGALRFPRSMAKIPTCTIYNPVTGAANSTRLVGGADYAVTGFTNIGKNGILTFNTATMPTVVAGATVRVHYTADTGW
jgi:hypothetical protein